MLIGGSFFHSILARYSETHLAFKIQPFLIAALKIYLVKALEEHTIAEIETMFYDNHK